MFAYSAFAARVDIGSHPSHLVTMTVLVDQENDHDAGMSNRKQALLKKLTGLF